MWNEFAFLEEACSKSELFVCCIPTTESLNTCVLSSGQESRRGSIMVRMLGWERVIEVEVYLWTDPCPFGWLMDANTLYSFIQEDGLFHLFCSIWMVCGVVCGLPIYGFAHAIVGLDNFSKNVSLSSKRASIWLTTSQVLAMRVASAFRSLSQSQGITLCKPLKMSITCLLGHKLLMMSQRSQPNGTPQNDHKANG